MDLQALASSALSLTCGGHVQNLNHLPLQLGSGHPVSWKTCTKKTSLEAKEEEEEEEAAVPSPLQSFHVRTNFLGVIDLSRQKGQLSGFCR